ncbi:MAG: glutamine--fructose-6-phosphate transaminase (isomerizing), partial [Candidatus Andersenbacteria bacterium]|nr:glutamine--fructose-6-phosphate transaminase (isomerizing) [Candidatus Andersenbacteria bacterium]
MCGIVGYVGSKEARSILLEGLQTLEYRGYDSAGVAVIQAGGIEVKKRAGRVADLAKELEGSTLSGTCGISHTRWATHGGVTNANAHPHTDEAREVAVVHNGVIENHAALRTTLEKEGVEFASETDTEVIAMLAARALRKVRTAKEATVAISKMVSKLTGTYGLLILSKKFPDTIFAARLGSPLLLGIAKHGYLVASDATAVSAHTDQVIYIEDGDVLAVNPKGYQFLKTERNHSVEQIEKVEMSEGLGKFTHYMQKEMYEQPASITSALRGHILKNEAIPRLSGMNITDEQAGQIDRIIFTACGTSYHAALVAEYWLEEIAGLPVEVEYASELRYRKSPVGDNTLVVAISQSGETADTLAALRELKRQGKLVRALVNVVGSSIAREAGGGLYLHAGPEIGVASTKAFTSQLAVLFLLTTYFARIRGVSKAKGKELLKELQNIPVHVKKALTYEHEIETIAERYQDVHTMLYLGRGTNYPVALEGALKLKEVSYIHAEGYPAAEMKHGPIALVDKETPSVIINPRSALYDKVMSNLEEIKARNG